MMLRCEFPTNYHAKHTRLRMLQRLAYACVQLPRHNKKTQAPITAQRVPCWHKTLHNPATAEVNTSTNAACFRTRSSPSDACNEATEAAAMNPLDMLSQS